MTPLRVADRAAWRAWLHENAPTADEVWLALGPGLRHADAVDEALCFGWIDSLARRHDGSFCQRFGPRSPRSAWSKLNRERVERLTALGRMTPAGRAAVELAVRTGTWSLLAEAQEGVVPADLARLLAADAAADRHFAAFCPSARRAALEWVARAKRPATRARRIARVVEAARENARP